MAQGFNRVSVLQERVNVGRSLSRAFENGGLTQSEAALPFSRRYPDARVFAARRPGG